MANVYAMTGGCGGGTIDLVYDYATRHGMFLESDLPYTASDGDSCPLADHEPVALLQGYVDLPENDLEVRRTAVRGGGVAGVVVGRVGGHGGAARVKG